MKTTQGIKMTIKTPDRVEPEHTPYLQDRDLSFVLLRVLFKRCITPGSVTIFGSLVLSLLLLIPAAAQAACSWPGPYNDVPPPLVTSVTGAAITQAQFDALAPVPDVITDCVNYIEKVATSYSMGAVVQPGTPAGTVFYTTQYLLNGYVVGTPLGDLATAEAWFDADIRSPTGVFGWAYANYNIDNITFYPNIYFSGSSGTPGYAAVAGIQAEVTYSGMHDWWTYALVGFQLVDQTYQLTTTTTTTYSVTTQYTLSLNNLKYKVEPSGTAAGDINSFNSATVQVVNTQTGQPYGGAKVRIKAGVTANSGGHDHDDALRPKGTLSSLTDCIEDGVADTIVCTTQTNGYVDFTFFAPEASGTHTITATCESLTCTAPASGDIKVQVDGLSPMPSSNLYVFVGAVPGFHTDNHYLMPLASDVALELARQYHAKFPASPLLHYNDTSLRLGGVLDICIGKETTPGCSSQCQLQPNGISYTCSWSAPHKEHRRGSVVDVRSNNDVSTAIPAANFQGFKNIARGLGADPGNGPHSPSSPTNRHWHVRLLGVAE